MRLLVLFFITYFSNAWTQNELLWQSEIGDGNSEFNPIVVPTNDGGLLCAGFTSSGASGTFASPIVTPNMLLNGQDNIYIVKYKADKTVEWQKSYGGYDGNINDASSLGDFISTRDGGWLLLGGSSVQALNGNKTAPSYGNFDFWVIKFDSTFNIQWQNSYGGSNDDVGVRAVELSDGSYLFAGNSNSSISGTKTDTCRGGDDYWLVKTDSSGNQLWDNTFGSTESEALEDMFIASSGDVFLSGVTYSDTANFFPSGDRSIAYGSLDYWVVCMNSFGDLIWEKTFGGPGADGLVDSHAVNLCSDGTNLYVTGSSNKYSIEAPTVRTAPKKGYQDVWIVKLDLSGNLLWDKAYGGDTLSAQDARLYYYAGTGSLIAAGESSSEAYGDKSDSCRGNFDYWLFKLDTAGNLLWDKTIGGSNADKAYSISIKDSNTYLIAGRSESPVSGDKTTIAEGLFDIWTVELGKSEAGVFTYDQEDFALYPNPTQDKLNICSKGVNGLKKLKVFDLSGKVVVEQAIQDGIAITTVSLKHLQQGTYFVCLIGANFYKNYKVIKD